MMQRNETALLDAWFRYHGYLFGLENLTVLDNGSTNAATVDILRRYERAGSVIAWGLKTEADFIARHRHCDDIVRGWAPDQFEHAIGLECDEFITVFNGTGLSCRRDDIEAFLDTLDGVGGHEVDLAFRGAPEMPGYYVVQTISRALWSSGSVSDTPRRPTELTLVVAAGRQAALPHGGLMVGLPDLGTLADALGIEGAPFGAVGSAATAGHRIVTGRGRAATVFDGRIYLELNPDVAAAGWPPLKHFIMHGHAERRRLATRARRGASPRTPPKAAAADTIT